MPTAKVAGGPLGIEEFHRGRVAGVTRPGIEQGGATLKRPIGARQPSA